MNAYLAIALVAALLALAVVLWGLKQRIDAANERRTITVNGKKYRVCYERIRRSAEEANERACRRCAFFDYYNCGGANCAKFIRTNRRDVETHYAYFRRLPDPGKRDDLAAALGAVVIVALLAFLLAFLLSGCSSEPADQEPTLPESGATYERLYDGFGKAVQAGKVTYEGHDYLLFSGRNLTTTFVLHSESCPCKTMEVLP